MGFWNGRVTFNRYRVIGENPLPFGDEILERIGQHLIGVHGSSAPADGIASGWAGGDHVLDLSVDLAKNVVNDAATRSVTSSFKGGSVNMPAVR